MTHHTLLTNRHTRIEELIEILPPQTASHQFETGGHNCQATQAEALAELLVPWARDAVARGVEDKRAVA